MSKKFVEVAKIGSTYGVTGELKLYPLASSIEQIISYGTWYIKSPVAKDYEILQNEHIFRKGHKVYIKLENVNDINTARKYVNSLIAVERQSLPSLQEDEIYWTDLIGLAVKNDKQQSFGIVKDIIETGYNDVLVCECKDKKEEYLIPYVKQYVLDINLNEKNILVDWEYDY